MKTAADTLNRTSKNEQGFTLIEILVAVLILSLGILGLIGMESLALKSNLSAYHRSQATILAYDLADKMRANAEGAGVGSSTTNEYLAAIPAKGVAHTNACVSYSGAVSGSGCTVKEIAERDVFEWFQQIDTILPNGGGSLAVSSGIQTVTIRWDENRNGSIDSSDPSFAFSFGL